LCLVIGDDGVIDIARLSARRPRNRVSVVGMRVGLFYFPYIPDRTTVGIASGYGLDGPVIESLWRRDFPHLSRPALGPTSLLYNGYWFFPGGKERPGRDTNPSPLLVPWSRKSRAIPLLPYRLYGLYRSSVPVQGCTLHLYLIFQTASEIRPASSFWECRLFLRDLGGRGVQPNTPLQL